MSDVKRYWLSTEGMCEVRGAPGDIQGVWVRTEDYDRVLSYAELLRRELEDCCTRMDRCKGILRADRQAPEGWNVLDTKHARAALAKNPAAANAPVVNVTEGRPAPLPEASAGPECVHETNRDAFEEWTGTPQGAMALTVARQCESFAQAAKVLRQAFAAGAELRHQSGKKSPTPRTDAICNRRGHETTPDNLRASAILNENDIEVGQSIADAQREHADLIELCRELESGCVHQVNREVPEGIFGPPDEPREPMVHTLKCHLFAFAAILRGEKCHEVRRFDRDYRMGDTVILKEWNEIDGCYTGRETRWLIGFVTYPGQWGLPPEVGAFSLAPSLRHAINR